MEPNEVTCLRCNGTGYAPRKKYIWIANKGMQLKTLSPCSPCDKCGGTGKIDWVKQVTGENILETWWEEDETATVLQREFEERHEEIRSFQGNEKGKTSNKKKNIVLPKEK